MRRRTATQRALCLPNRDTVGEPTSKFEKYFFLGKFPKLFCLQRRHVGHTDFGTGGLANSIPPFFETQLLIPFRQNTSSCNRYTSVMPVVPHHNNAGALPALRPLMPRLTLAGGSPPGHRPENPPVQRHSRYTMFSWSRAWGL